MASQQILRIKEDPPVFTSRLGGGLLVDDFSIFISPDARRTGENYPRLARENTEQSREPLNVDVAVAGVSNPIKADRPKESGQITNL